MAYIDGSSSGNPGEAGYGVVLKNEEGIVLKAVGHYIGQATNNVAEYHGLLGSIDLARQYCVRSLTVYSDSELLVNQMNGKYKVKKPHLKILHSNILCAIQAEAIRFQIVHISREQNREADALARRAVRLKAEVIDL